MTAYVSITCTSCKYESENGTQNEI